MLSFSLLLPTVCCKVPRFATVVTLRLFSLFLELGVLLRSEISSALVLLPLLIIIASEAILLYKPPIRVPMTVAESMLESFDHMRAFPSTKATHAFILQGRNKY